MAIIDNHKSVKIDQAFSDKHVEMFAFFNNKGIDVELSDNFKEFQNFLSHLPYEDYPYNFDESFMEHNIADSVNAFALYLKKDNEIVATYAAKQMQLVSFIFDFKQIDESMKMCEDVPSWEETMLQMYSSCQWVSKDHRGNGFGMMLDHLKKNICFDIFGVDVQYAIHKSQFADYHIKGLHYDESKWLATIPKGDVGGAGEKKDKVYNLTWISKESWANKLNDVRKLYTS